MDVAVLHYLPGRVRLHVPELCRKAAVAESALVWLRAQPGITSVRLNPACASLVVEFDRAHEPVLQGILARLRAVSAREFAALVAGAKLAAAAIPAPPQSVAAPKPAAKPAARPTRDDVPGLFSSRSPLGLPTLSLALAFSANPFVVAVNMPLMLWNAIPIARRAWRVWSNERRLNVDFLDVLAISASVMQADPLAGSLVTWLIKLGDWIRDLTAAGSRRAISGLLEFRSKSAWILRDGQITAIPAAELAVGDLVVVYPGEMIPVDGEIIEGLATIDQKTITGEGLPVTRGKGGAAFAATVIREGQLTLRATRVGTDTTAGQIAHLVESAPMGDTRMQNHAELLADRLVVPTLGLAVGTAALTRDFGRFLSLVIVDYGTGIRVAAPTSVLSSMTHAARAGIVIKSGGHMEKLAKADTIVFDKTGTLTHGVPAIVDVIGYVDHITPGHLLGLAAAAETRLHHPVAEALRTRALELAVNIPPCDETQYRVGLGVEGQVNGYYLHVGSERFMRDRDIRSQRRRHRPHRARSQRLFLPLYRGGRQARRPRRLCRQGAAGEPRGDQPAARHGDTQYHHVDRRQCGGGEGRQRAPRPDRAVLRHAAGGQGGRHPGTATPRQHRGHGRRRHQRFPGAELRRYRHRHEVRRRRNP